MRRLHPLLVSFLVTGSVACTDPPKPEKASEKELAKIEKEGAEGSTLGPIPSGPIAVVNGTEIPNEQFKEIYELKVKKYTDRGREIPTSADRRYRKSIAERLIWHEVLRQEGEKLGVEYDKDALAEREAQQRRGIRDWDKHLSRRGETEESLRAMYVAELLEKAILDKLGKLEVKPDEIDADYEKIKGNWASDKPRVRASHILIPIGPRQERPKPGEKPAEPTDEEKAKWEEEAKKKADELYAQATAEGADFEALAREHSTGPSAGKGGDIGIFTADRMAEEFSEVAFKLDPGDISKPVKTKFGYHIIKLTGKWPPGELPKEALEDQIINRLEQRKLHQGRRELKEELMAKYEIKDNIKPTLGPEPERRRRGKAAAKRRAVQSAKNPHGDPHGRMHAKEPADNDKPAGDAKEEAKAEEPAGEDAE